MPEAIKPDLESKLKLWIKKNKKENRRLEFKLRVELGTPGAKAELIRDVIALANSEGENPRDDGYLVIGFRDGQHHDIATEGYDGAKFGQILDSYIFPLVSCVYEEFRQRGRGHVGVLIIKPDTRDLYVVNKKLPDDKGQALLLPGQSWGRKSDRKVELSGEAIHYRLRAILDGRIVEETHPLIKRIDELEHQSGPAFEVRRIRFEMEATFEWAALEICLQRLIPYAREFDYVVKHEVLDAAMVVTGRARGGMPLDVAQSVETVLMEVMPDKGGGVYHPANEEFSEQDQSLLKRMEHATFEMTWDACRYLRDMEVVEVCARMYRVLIRIATLNRLRRLQSDCLQNAKRCRDICKEKRKGSTFPEGYKKLATEIADALDAFDAFDCIGYIFTTPKPKDLSPSQLATCIAIIRSGGAVDWNAAERELPLATSLAIAWSDMQIVGLGAIKRKRSEYAESIAAKSGVDFPAGTLELGYVAVAPAHRGHHLSDCLVKMLLKQYAGRLFATTYNEYMKDALIRAGFENKGKEWKGRNAMLSFWELGSRSEIH